MGVARSISIGSFSVFKIIETLSDIKFMFGMCRHSLDDVTPVKYEHYSKL